MTVPNEDLRPCPFCGNTSITVLGELPASYRPDLHEASTSLVQCGNCKATAKGKQRWNERKLTDDTNAIIDSDSSTMAKFIRAVAADETHVGGEHHVPSDGTEPMKGDQGPDDQSDLNTPTQ